MFGSMLLAHSAPFTTANGRDGLIGLAPMEGVIDATTRRLLSERGGIDWIVTEFVRVVDQPLPPRVFYRTCPELSQRSQTTSGTPVQLQLLGSDPQAMAANARVAVECGAMAIDINFGCPAKTVNRHGGGASMLRTPNAILAIVSAIYRAVPDTPISAKLRLGFDDRQQAFDCAHAAVCGGARWLTLHARTRKQGYRPPAHWEWIERLRQHIGVPIVANGDIWTLDDYWQARALAGCSHVMLGRGLLSDPLLARRIRHWQRTGERLPATPWPERAAILRDLAAELQAKLPEKVMLSLLKQWLSIMQQHDEETAVRFLLLRSHRRVSDLLEALNDAITP